MLHLALFSLTVLSLSRVSLSSSPTDTNLNVDSKNDPIVYDNVESFDISNCGSSSSSENPIEGGQNDQNVNLVSRDSNICPKKGEWIRPAVKKIFNIPWRAPKNLPQPNPRRQSTEFDNRGKCPYEERPIPVTCAGPEVWYDNIFGYVVDCRYGWGEGTPARFRRLHQNDVAEYCCREYYFIGDLSNSFSVGYWCEKFDIFEGIPRLTPEQFNDYLIQRNL